MADKTGGPAFPGYESDNISLTPRERQIYISAYSRGIIDGQREALKRMSELYVMRPVRIEVPIDILFPEKERREKEREG